MLVDMKIKPLQSGNHLNSVELCHKRLSTIMQSSGQKLKLIVVLISMILLLTVCPVPVTNKTFLNEQAKLPYEPRPGKGIVYITQSYSYVDWYLIGGMASDGDMDDFPGIFVKSNNSSYVSLGKLHSGANICFNALPGTYTIKFVRNKLIDDGSKPEEIIRTFTLSENAIRFFSFDSTSATDKKVNFIQLDEGKGRAFTAKSKTPPCLTLFEGH
jgi:hypothetical protein